MRDSIVNNAPWFALGWLGSVVAGTGLGALALSMGVPLLTVICAQLVLQAALSLAVLIAVPDRFGGFVAVCLAAMVPFGAFVGWAEVTLSSTTTAAALVASLGAAVMCVAGWRSLAARGRQLEPATVTA